MTRKEAIAELTERAFQHGLSVKEDRFGVAIYERSSDLDYLMYTVYHDNKPDFNNRRADITLRVNITIRRMGGDGMTPDELLQVSRTLENAREFLLDIQNNPIKYEERW